MAQEAVDDALQRAQTILTELQATRAREQARFEAERGQLRSDEFALSPVRVDIAALEEARLEIAARRARSENLAVRLAARRNARTQIQGEIAALAAELAEEQDADRRLALEQALARQKELAGLQDELVAVLDDLQQLAQRRLQLMRQAQALLQSRFELPALAAGAGLPAVAPAAQAAIDRQLAAAAQLRNEAAGLDSSSAAGKARVRLLELQAQQADDRAELAQLRIAHGQYQELLKALESLAASRAIAPQILRRGAANLEVLAGRLQVDLQLLANKRDVLVDQRDLTEQQGEIASGDDSTLKRRLRILDELIAELDATHKALVALVERRDRAATLYQSTIAQRSQAALLEWRPWPQDAEAWRLLLDGLARLPGRVVTQLGRVSSIWLSAWTNLGMLAQAGLLMWWLGLVGVMALLRRQALRVVVRAQDAPLMQIPAQVTAAIAYRALPALLLGSTALLLGLPASATTLMLVLLLLWPAIHGATLAARLLLLEAPSPARLRLFRELRWVILITGVLAALLVIGLEVALSPTVRDALDRLSMLCLIAVMVPALHLRAVIQGAQASVGVSPLRRLAASASLVLPMLLLLCAGLGLAGYVNLSWAIAGRLGWFVLVALGVLLIAGVLADGLARFSGRLAQREDGGDFYRRYLLQPLYRLSLLLLLIGAGVLLVQLFGWNAQTPLVGKIPGMLGAVLFKVGEAQIKVGDLILALAIVFLVFWFGDWSKQVSYRFAYARINDLGVRESLATFTQYLVIVFGLLVALKTIGLDLTALTVFAGALGIGIGFGLQQIVVNFISGLLLLVERPLKTRDIVNVDQYEGEVTRIGIRALTVKTWDNQEVVIPNSSVITKPFINWTHGDDVMRTLLLVGIGYDDDPNAAMALVADILREHPAVLDNPAPKVLLWEFADSSMTLRLQFHTHIRGSIGRADVRSQILATIWTRFRAAGITIPYPQRVLHQVSGQALEPSGGD